MVNILPVDGINVSVVHSLPNDSFLRVGNRSIFCGRWAFYKLVFATGVDNTIEKNCSICFDVALKYIHHLIDSKQWENQL